MTNFKPALFAVIAIATVATFAPPAAAIEYPWCAQYSGRGGGNGRNCGFETYQQCMATVSGIGGYCERNAFYTEGAKKRAKRVRQRGDD